MLPIRIFIKDFCGHLHTEFSFDTFSSAVIIGKVRNNDRFSNGAGKSTIFYAIEYVLFNEVNFSSLEKIIRDGSDVCKVEFDFQSSIDKNTYRIIRSNSRKTGTDVRLFKLIKDDNWEDLTQRRVSDTEKEIIKIVGFNYKAFCASVLFTQSGSENNIQKDFGNLPSLTPEKRKSVLREVLQLDVYNKYEKLAKNKLASTQSLLDKQKIILSSIDDPEINLPILNKENELLSNELDDIYIKFNIIKENLLIIKTEYSELSSKISISQNKIEENKHKIQSINEQVEKYNKSIINLEFEINNLPKEAKEVQNKIDFLTSELLKLNSQVKDTDGLKSQLSVINNNLVNIKSNIVNITNKINELETPISSDKVCNHCHQIVSEEHKQNWQNKAKIDIQNLKSEKTNFNSELSSIISSKDKLENEIDSQLKIKQKIFQYENNNKSLLNDLNSKRELYKKYQALINENKNIINSKKIELELSKKELNTYLSDNNSKSITKLASLKFDLNEFSKKETDIKLHINNLIGKQAIIKHKITQCEENIIKISLLKKEIIDLEKSTILHSKVAQAFGSNGIPALITNSILDELQNEANQWILKLRPGLQLKFVVINEKSSKNKEKEDTLEISYFIDGKQREYKQLSGAQKIIVSLSIKLALLFIMNKRLGVDIRLMLLDEVDQALDPGSKDIFADIIKVLQNEFKVIVITFNEELKHKFSHAILVEQDENNVSQGKLINW